MNDVNTNKDYYDVLFLKRDCDKKSIKKSYRKLSKKYHPDKNDNDDAEDKFQAINEAYEVLYDVEKRIYYDKNSPYGNKYDYKNHTIHSKTFSHKYDKDFQERKKYYNKLDIYTTINITFKEFYDSKPLNIIYYRLMMCDDCDGYGSDSSDGIECAMCDGTGKMYTVLKGDTKCQMCGGKKYISENICNPCNGQGLYEKKQVINLKNLSRFSAGEEYTQEYKKGGNYSKNNKKYGKFFLKIIIEQDSNYKIGGDNILHRKIDVHYIDAIKGNKIIYNHIDSKTYKIDLPEKSKDGDIIKLSKKGLKEGVIRKDLHLHINIVIDYNRI